MACITIHCDRDRQHARQVPCLVRALAALSCDEAALVTEQNPVRGRNYIACKLKADWFWSSVNFDVVAGGKSSEEQDDNSNPREAPSTRAIRKGREQKGHEAFHFPMARTLMFYSSFLDSNSAECPRDVLAEAALRSMSLPRGR